MAKFTPKEDSGLLEYDFTAIPKPDGGYCSGKGVVPEPNREKLREYREQIAQAFDASQNLDEEDVDAARQGQLTENARRLATGGVSQALQVFDNLNAQTRNLLAGTQALEHYEELPGRIQDQFALWIMQELMNPEVPGAATNESPAAPTNAAPSTQSGATSG